MKPFLTFVLGLSLAGQAGAACFTMYDTKNVIVSQSFKSPVDLSQQIGTQMASRFPSRYLVVSPDDLCGRDASTLANTDEAGSGRGAAESALRRIARDSGATGTGAEPTGKSLMPARR